MADYTRVIGSMRICLNVDRDSNCLSECFGCNYIDHDDHIMDMVRDAADAIEKLLVEKGMWHQRYQLEHEKVEKLRSAVPHWTSVEEYRDTIIHTLQEHRMQMDESYDDSDFALGYAEAFKIVCMMPLPEAPKEVE